MHFNFRPDYNKLVTPIPSVTKRIRQFNFYSNQICIFFQQTEHAPVLSSFFTIHLGFLTLSHRRGVDGSEYCGYSHKCGVSHRNLRPNEWDSKCTRPFVFSLQYLLTPNR